MTVVRFCQRTKSHPFPLNCCMGRVGSAGDGLYAERGAAGVRTAGPPGGRRPLLEDGVPAAGLCAERHQLLQLRCALLQHRRGAGDTLPVWIRLHVHTGTVYFLSLVLFSPCVVVIRASRIVVIHADRHLHEVPQTTFFCLNGTNFFFNLMPCTHVSTHLHVRRCGHAGKHTHRKHHPPR